MIAKLILPRHHSVNVRDLVIDNAIPDIFVAEAIALNNLITVMKVVQPEPEVILVNKQLLVIIQMIAILIGGLPVRRLACHLPRKNP